MGGIRAAAIFIMHARANDDLHSIFLADQSQRSTSVGPLFVDPDLYPRFQQLTKREKK